MNQLYVYIYLEEGMASHSSILAWRIPWTEEPSGLTVHRVEQSRTRLKWLSRQTYIYLLPHGPVHPITHTLRSSQSTKLASCAIQQIPTTYMFYTWWCISVIPNLPVLPTLHFSPLPRPHVCSLCPRLYSCLGNSFICVIFLDSTSMW